jgi:hypothetical protein
MQHAFPAPFEGLQDARNPIQDVRRISQLAGGIFFDPIYDFPCYARADSAGEHAHVDCVAEFCLEAPAVLSVQAS